MVNLVLVCPFHHRLHHRGQITIRGPGGSATVTTPDGRVLTGASLARPPTNAPPSAPAYRGPPGEPAQWRWYDPPVPADAPSASDN